MTYFSRETCELFAKKGLTSESGKFYFNLFGSDPEILDGDDVIDYTDPTDDVVFAGVHPVTVNYIPFNHDVYEKVPAFQISDILLNAANAKLLFPDVFSDHAIVNSTMCTWCGHSVDPKTKCLRRSSLKTVYVLLEKLWAGEDIEKYILEAVKL